MEDIGVLEKRVFGKPKTATGEDLMRLARHYFEKFQAEKDYRARQKLVNHAGFFAGWAAKTKTLNKEELDECIKILRSAERGESVQAYLPMAITEWLKVQGIGEPQIIAEKRGGVAVADMWGVGDEKWAMTMEVENGTYKIAAYMFDTAKFFGYVIVMCKA